MLLPTQVAAGRAITDSMQSMIETIEERRRQEEEKKRGRKDDPLVNARISASSDARHAQSRIAEALFGMNKVDINELKMQLVNKLGEKLGISRDDGMSSYAYGRAIEDAMESIGAAGSRDLIKELGLDELDISLKELVNAIKAPWGEENDRLEEALEHQHGDGRTTSDQRAKVLQRLDDASNPKTLQELKLGPQYSDPTRVVDEETRAERLDDIKVKEAAEKLDDVRDVQEVLKERLQKGGEKTEGERKSDDPDGVDDLLMLSLTAQTEINEQAQDMSAKAEETSAGDGATADSAATGDLDTVRQNDAEPGEKPMTDENDIVSGAQALAARMQLDDIGVYGHHQTP